MSLSRILFVLMFVLTMLFFKVKDKFVVLDQAEANSTEVSDDSKFIALKNNKILKLNLKDFLYKP